MTPSQRDKVRRLAASNFSVRDIVSLTGYDRDDVRYALYGPAALRVLKRRLLARVPAWWTGTTSGYTRCVEANFADVA